MTKDHLKIYGDAERLAEAVRALVEYGFFFKGPKGRQAAARETLSQLVDATRGILDAEQAAR